MANNRWKYGDTKPVVARCNLGTTIDIGDLVFLFGALSGLRDLRRASDIPDQGSLAANQHWFKCRFLGHASERHRPHHDPLDNPDLRVNSAGVHEYDCASSTWEIGDYVGVAENAAGDRLLDQTVIRVPNEATNANERIIGVVARREPVARTRVFIQLISEVLAGGIEGGVCSGSSSGA